MLSVRVGVSGCSRRPSHVVADLDARVTQIDAAIAEATKRGKTNAALSAMEGQRRTRAGLVDERNREGALSGNPSRRNAPAWPLRQQGTLSESISPPFLLEGADRKGGER